MKNRINKWIIDNYLIDSSYQDDLYKKLTTDNFEIFRADYIPFLNDKCKIPEDFKSENVGIYGSFEFVKKYTSMYPNVCAFQENSNFNCSVYLSEMRTDEFLNADNLFTTIGLLKKNRKQIFNYFNSEQIFIRPNSGFKVFTGFPVSFEELDFELSSLKQLYNIEESALIMISKGQSINEEYRFVIANNEVITGTSYKVGDKIDINKEPDNSIIDFVNNYLKLNKKETSWTPDSCFILDVAKLSNNELKIIELNAFSHSDFYNSDFVKAFNAASKILYEELND